MSKRNRLKRKITALRKKKALIRKKKGEFLRRKKSLKKREEAAITDEEIDAVEEEVTALEEEVIAFEEEHTETEEQLQVQIDELVEELEVLEEELGIDSEEDLGIEPTETGTEEEEEERSRRRGKAARARGAAPIEDNRRMRGKTWGAMTRSQVKQLVAQPEMRTFLQRIRDIGTQKRSVKGAQLTIPDLVLEILRDNIDRYSKLMKHINLRPIKGTARQTISPSVVEAIWTEMCATLNELDIKFTQIEVDGYKVGGYVVICNATLADSDLNLAEEIIDALGQAIGYAIDKAIIYGKGKKMPIGILTRLIQAAEPENWNPNAPDWIDLRENIMKASAANLTDIKLFQEFVKATGKAKENYSNGNLVWTMNKTTWTTLQSKMLSFNAAGALVSALGEDMVMPVVGGAIETLDFIPEGDIIGGYGSNYVLAEREGTTFAQSEHVMFIQDNTVFKGTARYDGTPVFGESFIAFNIEGKEVTTEMDFAADKANEEAGGEG